MHLDRSINSPVGLQVGQVFVVSLEVPISPTWINQSSIPSSANLLEYQSILINFLVSLVFTVNLKGNATAPAASRLVVFLVSRLSLCVKCFFLLGTAACRLVLSVSYTSLCRRIH
jgi:hypothetical protein